MLAKLIKNEFKATARNFFPVYLVMIVVSIFMKIMEEITDNATGSLGNNKLIEILSTLSVIMFVIAIMAVIFGTIVLIIKRFYDNMLKDEGYLSFTLPVTTGQHIAGKALVSYVWVIASVLVIIASVIILLLGNGSEFTKIGDNIRNFFELINEAGWWGYFIEVVVMILLSVYAKIMLAYTCLSVGQIWNKHRVAGAIGVYFIIYIITQIIGTVFLSNMLISDTIVEETDMGFFQPLMLYLLIFAVVESIVFTVITHFMLNRKLNLE